MGNVTKLPQDKWTITCAEKNVYGRILIYVHDEYQARMLAALTNKSTLDYRDLEALQNLGFSINLIKLPA
jgi:hypothetical protein